MSVGGSEQKRSGFSPGTSTLSSFTETWFPLSHDDRAETVAVRTTGRRSEVSFIVGECYSGRKARRLRWNVVSGSERWSWKLVVAVVIGEMTPPSLAAESKRGWRAPRFCWFLLVRLSDEAFLPVIFAVSYARCGHLAQNSLSTLAFSLVSLFNHIYVLPKPYVLG